MMGDLEARLRKRAEIWRSIAGRKSNQLGEPDRIADILDEAAGRLADLEHCLLRCAAQLEKSELFAGYGDGPLREPATINSIEMARHLLRKSPTT